MPVQRDFDAGVQRGRLKWLGDVAHGSGFFGAPHSGAVGVRGQIDHRDVKPFPQHHGCERAIHVPLDTDIHQSDIRRVSFGLFDGVGGAGDSRGHAIS